MNTCRLMLPYFTLQPLRNLRPWSLNFVICRRTHRPCLDIKCSGKHGALTRPTGRLHTARPPTHLNLKLMELLGHVVCQLEQRFTDPILKSKIPSTPKNVLNVIHRLMPLNPRPEPTGLF